MTWQPKHKCLQCNKSIYDRKHFFYNGKSHVIINKTKSYIPQRTLHYNSKRQTYDKSLQNGICFICKESAVKLNRHLEEAHDITIDPKNRRCGFLLKFKDDLNGNGNASGTQKDTPFDPYFYFRPKIRQTEAKVDFNGKSESNSSAAATGSTAGSSKADEGVCLVCGKVFMLKEEARKHLLLYHGISENASSHAGHSSLSCYELENVEFEDMEKVYKSLSSTSSSAKSFTCQLCFMALKSHESLVRHFRIVHDIRVLAPQQQKHDNGVDAQQDNTQMFDSKMEMENMTVLVAVRDD